MVVSNLVRGGRFSSVAAIFVVALAAWGCGTVQSNSQTPQAQKVTISVDPPSASLKISTTQKFTAVVSNASNTAVTWQVEGVAGGDATHGIIDATGMYTAPAAVPSPATVTIAAVAVASPAVFDVAQATITATAPAISVTLSPATVSVQAGKTQNVTATVQNDSQNKGVTWTLSSAGCTGTACGTLSAATSASGAAITYTAPAKTPSPAAVTLTAKAVADTTKTAASIITVTATAPPPTPIAVTVNPTSATVLTVRTQTFTATVQNDSQNKGVTWVLSGAGSLSSTSSASGASITYTAPSRPPTPATVTLTAKSVADSSKTAAATITVTSTPPPPPPVITVSVSPTSASVQTGNTHTISASVQNDSGNKGVIWTLSGSGCSGSACGSLSSASSASGSSITYAAPGSAPSPATVTLSAKSVADTSKSASATFTITAPPPPGGVTVSISPKRVGLTTGQTQTLTANVAGVSNTSVTWEVDTVPGGNSSTGTISSTGVYTPPSSAGSHTVAARSVADTTVSASASVAITDLGGVYTYHNDLFRDGVNSKEYALNTSNVKSSTFGKRFSCAIDAGAYAQPLWVANVAISGGTHNVLIAASQHDTVYAFDADASPCRTYWSKSLLASGETWVTAGDVGTGDITNDIGIVGTPVIDPNTKTIYVVSKSKNGGTFHQRLHALSLIDGSEKFSGPQDINFTSGGHTFDPLRQNERCGLALVNGVVYIAYASHGDQPTYYGWVVGYNASSLALASVFNDDPNSAFGGIWMAGGAPAADSSNNLYVITGNGNFDGNTEFGDSFLRLSSGLGLSSSFTPTNESSLNGSDADLGSGGAAILVDQNSSPVPHLVIGGGKEGKLYLLNRESLGGKNSGDTGAVQTFTVGNGIFATPAFWQNTLYLGPTGDSVKAFSFDTASGKFSTSPSSTAPGTFGFPGSTPSISSQGSSNGIVWAIQRNGSAVLHAYDATNLGNELWNSNNSADQAGGAVKFTVPTVANGKVYVGTASEITVYGLSPN
jgi:hypothetical protein